MKQTYYKITNKAECHNGFQYVDGLNMLDKPFEQEGSCVVGGLYFTTAKHIFKFLDYGCYLREIMLPQDCLWVKDPDGDKFRADKIILGKRYDLTDPLTFQLLLEEGTDIHMNDNCALDWASKNGYLEIVKYLIENGADIRAYDDRALQLASKNGYLEIVKYLVENGADIRAYNDRALQLACENGHLKTIMWLVENGADIEANNNFALKWAARNGYLHSLDWFVETGSDIDANIIVN